MKNYLILGEHPCLGLRAPLRGPDDSFKRLESIMLFDRATQVELKRERGGLTSSFGWNGWVEGKVNS